MLCDPQLCGYEETHIRLLHDDTATQANILAGLDCPVALLLGGKGLSGAGWQQEQARIPQPAVQVTQTVTGNGNIVVGTGNGLSCP